MSAWAGLIQGAHALIAMKLDQPHWLMNDGDARAYGVALANAVRHLPIGATQKALDFSALFICAVQMETPRVYQSMHMARARKAQREQPQPQGATVFQFRPPPPSSSPPPPTPNGAGTVHASHGASVEGFQEDGVDGPIGGHH